MYKALKCSYLQVCLSTGEKACNQHTTQNLILKNNLGTFQRPLGHPTTAQALHAWLSLVMLAF